MEFLSRYRPEVRELMLRARRMVLGEFPAASETVNDVSYTITVGFTFSGRFREAFCYAVAGRTYINIGFPRGTELADPAGRLAGTGKLHRHVRIESEAELGDTALRELIHQAAERAQAAGGPVAPKPGVVVRESAARKRRTRP